MPGKSRTQSFGHDIRSGITNLSTEVIGVVEQLLVLGLITAIAAKSNSLNVALVVVNVFILWSASLAINCYDIAMRCVGPFKIDENTIDVVRFVMVWTLTIVLAVILLLFYVNIIKVFGAVQISS